MTVKSCYGADGLSSTQLMAFVKWNFQIHFQMLQLLIWELF